MIARLLLVLLVAAPAHAFVRQRVPGGGPCSFWASRTLDFWINSDGTADVSGAGAFLATRNSFQNWQAVDCTDLAFTDHGLTSRRDVGFIDKSPSNLNLILWRKKLCADTVPAGEACLDSGTCANQFDCWDHPAGVIGSTLNTFVPRTGQIVDSDIELNDAVYFFTVTDNAVLVRTDIENTLTHEIGHVIGLDHTPVLDATMAATAREGETEKRTLEPDDIAGVCAIYPAGKQVVTCLADGEIAVDEIDSDDDNGCLCGSAAGSAAWLWALPLGWTALRRWRRGR